jgi:hypothetical protein
MSCLGLWFGSQVGCLCLLALHPCFKPALASKLTVVRLFAPLAVVSSGAVSGMHACGLDGVLINGRSNKLQR